MLLRSSRRPFCLAIVLLFFVPPPLLAADATTRPLDHVHVDLPNKRIEIDCEALNVDIPLEFFCVTNGGNEHESVLRTPAKPSDIHFALLMLGLTAGHPATYDPARKLWLPPHGSPLR